MTILFFWLTYFIILVVAFVYFYYFPYYVPKKKLADSIIMANGFASGLSLILFLWVIPEILKISPVYPGPATLVNFIIVLFYGSHLGKSMKPVEPKGP